MEEEVAQFCRPGHKKKRSLKNKSLSIPFDEKNLRDFVTGFQKRKKKRRKEAKLKQAEAQRQKRIQQRKHRKLEMEHALFGGVPPCDGLEEEEYEDRQENGTTGAVSGMTMTYEDVDTKVTVVTSDIIQSKDQKRHTLCSTSNTPPDHKISLLQKPPPPALCRRPTAKRKHIPSKKEKHFSKYKQR